MKTLRFALLALCLFFAVAAGAQEYFTGSPRYSIAARPGAEFDYKVFKGFHLTAGESLHLVDSDTKTLVRSYTKVGVSYKVCPYFKCGLGYTFIAAGKKLSDGTKEPWLRHRPHADVTGMYSFGDFKLSLRERFQGTARCDDYNRYQTPGFVVDMRSRLKLSYSTARSSWSPYTYAELTNSLNAVNLKSWEGTVLVNDNVMYNDVYVKNIRAALGTEYQLSRHSSLDFHLLYDLKRKKDIDASKKGKLKSVYGELSNVFTFVLIYKFSM